MTAGLLLVDKPAGVTSHDVVALVRKRFGSKVGHAGTLDPMATGLMLIGVGAATRVLQFLVGLDKSYLATVRLGWATDTDDATGQRIAADTKSALPAATEIDSALAKLTGEQQQLPSRYSAKKVGGRRAYDLARAGADFELKPRRIVISALERIGEIDNQGEFLDFELRVDCSSGTYVRAIARDLGESLGCGGHLTALRRTRIGRFQIAQAGSPETAQLTALPDALKLLFATVELSAEECSHARNGRLLRDRWPELNLQPTQHIAALDAAGRGVCMLERNQSGFQPKIVFAEEEQ